MNLKQINKLRKFIDNPNANDAKNFVDEHIEPSVDILKYFVITAFLMLIPFILYAVFAGDKIYTYDDKKFKIVSSEVADAYISSNNVTSLDTKEIDATKDGISKLIDSYHAPLFDKIGPEGAEVLKNMNYLSAYDVKDDGKEVTIQVLLNKEIKFGYSKFDFENSDHVFTDLYSVEVDKLLMATAYRFKDSRDVHIQIGKLTTNSYNDTVFSGIENSEYAFKSDDLKRVKNWPVYNVDKLKGLNRL